MSYENILTQQKDKISIITVHRPDQLNALNKATIDELHKAIIAAEQDENKIGRAHV